MTAPSNTQNLGYNYRGQAWSDGNPITRVPMADGSNAEGVAALAYRWTGALWVPQTIPATVTTGKVTVTTAGTRVEIIGSATPIQSVTIKALAANTGAIYVGNSGVTSSNGFALAKGDTVSLDLVDLSTIWIDCSVNGEGVTYLAVT